MSWILGALVVILGVLVAVAPEAWKLLMQGPL
jgi:hypothetical protein